MSNPCSVGLLATADETMMAGYRTHDIGVIHGVIASDLARALVAALLTGDPGTRIIAPDLLGRGPSAGERGSFAGEYAWQRSGPSAGNPG